MSAPSIAIETVGFAAGDGSGHNVPIPLRKNDETSLPAEWSRTTPTEPGFVAYGNRGESANQLLLHLSICNSTGGPVSGTICAEPTGAPLLGNVQDYAVEIPAASRSTLEIPIASHSLLGAHLGRYDIGWRWTLSDAKGQALDSAESLHTVYVVLGRPTAPWVVSPSDSLSLPWTDALDVACDWARGATTPAEAATRITHRLQALGAQIRCDRLGTPMVAYNQAQHFVDGAAPCVRTDENKVYPPSFFARRFLRLLQNDPDVCGLLNCDDCATVVSTFANLLGADLDQIFAFNGDFHTHEVLLIGQDPQQWASQHFDYHSVALHGGADASGLIWDACLIIDREGKPGKPPRRAEQVVGMRMGKRQQEGYLYRLMSVPGNQTATLPRYSRQRRVLVSESIPLDLNDPTEKKQLENALPQGFAAPPEWSSTPPNATLDGVLDQMKNGWLPGLTVLGEGPLHELAWTEATHQLRCTLPVPETGTDVELAVRILELPAPRIALDMLWQMIQQLPCPELRKELPPGIGDVAFRSGHTAYLFARAQFIVQLSLCAAVGVPPVSLEPVLPSAAKAVDELLTGAAGPAVAP